MKLKQAVLKLARTSAYGFNTSTLVWEPLDFKISYTPDTRVIGRNVAFFDRRLFISPVEIPSLYSLVKIGLNDSEVLMVYSSQENINRDTTYLYSNTGFNVQGYANLFRLIKTPSASGVSGAGVKTLVGSYPVALERGFSGPQNPQAAGVYNTRMGCYIPAYADVKLSDTLEFGQDVFTIDESVPELKLRFLQLTRR